MNAKQIFVIIDTSNYTKDDITTEIKEEGYNHLFFFSNFHPADVANECLKTTDEVWCFGDCSNLVYYEKAKSMGCDIWQMR